LATQNHSRAFALCVVFSRTFFVPVKMFSNYPFRAKTPFTARMKDAIVFEHY